jgi:hypothetical protein
LGLTVPSNYQISKITKSAFSQFILSPKIPAVEDLQALRDGINTLLPSETVAFRVSELLVDGSEIMTARRRRLSRLSTLPTLVMTGGEDKLLPSKIEGIRLKEIIGENCTLKNFPKGKELCRTL